MSNLVRTVRYQGLSYRLTMAREGDDFDVRIEVRSRGSEEWATLVVGMYGSMLDLSEFGPKGDRVTIDEELFELLNDEAEELAAESKLDDEDEDES